jgi:hypothetical protein
MKLRTLDMHLLTNPFLVAVPLWLAEGAPLTLDASDGSSMSELLDDDDDVDGVDDGDCRGAADLDRAVRVLEPILPNTIFPILHILVRFYYKYV